MNNNMLAVADMPKNTVSKLPRDGNTLSSDLYFISRSLNEPYNTKWQSKAIVMADMAHSLAEHIAATDYASKFEQLEEIYNKYLNSENLSICYDKDSKQILLVGNEEAFSSIDASIFTDTYSAGNGLCCENKTFSIDTDVVALKSHNHASADITDLSRTLADFYTSIKNSLSNDGYCVTFLDYPEET